MPDRDVEWNLKANDRSGPAAKSAADGLENVADKADKAQRKLDDVGDKAGQVARKLLETRVAAAALAREFDKTGDTKLLKDFEKLNRDAAKLGRVMKTLTPEPPKLPKVQNPEGFFGDLIKGARKAGLIAGDFAVEGFSDAFKGLGTAGPTGTYIIAGLVGAATAAAPIIAGALEGAVLAGLGAGGIATGLILAAKDPRVVAEYSALGGRIAPKLQEAARPFATDLLKAAPKFEAAFDQELPRIQRTMAGLATVLGPIIDDVIAAAHKLGPAIERAALTGGQILKALATQLPALAGDVGDLLNAFSDAGPGAAAALGLIIFQLRGLIELLALGARGSAPFLNMFGKLAEATKFVPATGGWEHHLDTIDKTGAAAGQAAGQYDNLRTSMQNTADAAQNLNDSISRLFGEQMSVDQANLAVNTGLATLTETIKGNKRTLDESTEAGRQNNSVILAQIQNLEQKRVADIAAGNGTLEATNKANGAYNAQLEGLRNLLYSLGLNKAEVDKLINAYEILAQPQVKNFTTVFRTVGSIPPGYSDQKTGHSRTGSGDYGALDGWAPARFNGSERTTFAESSGRGYQPAVTVNSEHAFTVTLDGQPFQAKIVRTVDAAGKRSAWRAKVGKR